MTTLPWLDYAGQDTQELLARSADHRVDSLLCAFEDALLAKAGRAGNQALTEEEQLVLAVEALEREVNNGGFHQFFTNSSHQYAPIIVDSLRRIGAEDAADLAEEALGALRLRHMSPAAIRSAAELAIVENDTTVLEQLDDCDQRYYSLTEIEPKLFAFIQQNASRIDI